MNEFEIIKSYREMFKLPVCSVIFFNHESPLRSKGYVVKKIIHLSLTFDHRALDGVPASNFLDSLVKNIESI